MRLLRECTARVLYSTREQQRRHMCRRMAWREKGILYLWWYILKIRIGGDKMANVTPLVAVTEEDFVGYIRFRMLDSIGSAGDYRRFVNSRREQKAEWAVKMYAQVHAVHAAIRVLSAHEAELKSSHTLRHLLPVWQYVVDNSMPPTDLPVVIGNCQLSGKRTVACVLIKCKGRGGVHFTISSSFTPFLLRLWVIFRMDVLIKLYTRQCLEAVPFFRTAPLAGTVAAIDLKHAETRALASGMYKAYVHVLLSVQNGLSEVI